MAGRAAYLSVFILFYGIPLCSAAQTLGESSPSPLAKPNVIILLIDALRADYLGVHGFQGDISPNLDNFAKSSAVFSNCMSQASWTKASVASLFTSKNPLSHRCIDVNFKKRIKDKYWDYQQVKSGAGPVSDEQRAIAAKEKVKYLGEEMLLIEALDLIAVDALQESEITLAEVLRAEGYRTASFSGGNGWISKGTNLVQGFEHSVVEYVEPCPFAVDFCTLPGYVLSEKAVEWLDSGARDRPFFMYLHYMDVHSPYVCPPEDWLAMRKSPSLGENRQMKGWEFKLLPDYVAKSFNREDPSRMVNDWKACYAAGIRQFDRNFASILRMFSDRGALDNTILIVTSDHGEEFLEHGKWAHGKDLHREQIHVPLFIKLPRGQGVVISDVVSSIDIMPTILSLVGAKRRPEGMQGQNLEPLLSGGRLPGGGSSFSAGLERYLHRISLRTADYKLIYDLTPSLEIQSILNDPDFQWDFPKGQRGLLYDVRNDPGEENDVFAARPEDAAKLIAEMKKWYNRSRPIQPSSGDKENKSQLSEKEVERLKSLGYMK